MFKFTYKLKTPVVNVNGLSTLESVSFRPLALKHMDLQFKLKSFMKIIKPIIDKQMEDEIKAAADAQERESKMLASLDKQKLAEYEKQRKKERVEAEKEMESIQKDPERMMELTVSIYLDAINKADGDLLGDIAKLFFLEVQNQAASPKVKDHLILFNEGAIILEDFQTERNRSGFMLDDLERLFTYFLLLVR